MSGYIGTAPVPQATQTRDSFTATSGQTSFATGGYTPLYLDLFMNGVKLASADYTATNGSDVVLASGAATGDILEVVAFTTFTPANIPSGTPSIDDNGNATALTIDSSENVMVGKTSLDGTGSRGIELRPDGLILASKSNAQPMSIDRNGTNGDVLWIGKNGSNVGSIVVDPSNIAIGSGDTGIYFNSGDDALIPVGTGNNLLSSRDNAIDLGRTNARFKDAYLSGGVYLGGTGSANKLDDYEEGTWTPVLVDTSSTPTFHNNLARYTKIGRVVTLTFFQQTNANPQFSVAGSSFKITGIPFAVLGSGYTGSQGFMNCQGFDFNGSNNTANISGQVSPAVINTHNELRFVVSGSGQTRGEVKNSGAASGYIIEATIIYYTDA